MASQAPRKRQRLGRQSGPFRVPKPAKQPSDGMIHGETIADNNQIVQWCRTWKAALARHNYTVNVPSLAEYPDDTFLNVGLIQACEDAKELIGHAIGENLDEIIKAKTQSSNDLIASRVMENKLNQLRAERNRRRQRMALERMKNKMFPGASKKAAATATVTEPQPSSSQASSQASSQGQASSLMKQYTTAKKVTAVEEALSVLQSLSQEELSQAMAKTSPPPTKEGDETSDMEEEDPAEDQEVSNLDKDLLALAKEASQLPDDLSSDEQ